MYERKICHFIIGADINLETSHAALTVFDQKLHIATIDQVIVHEGGRFTFHFLNSSEIDG